MMTFEHLVTTFPNMRVENVSLGVYILALVKKIGAEIRPKLCVILSVTRYTV